MNKQLIIQICRIKPAFLSTFLESYLHEVLPTLKHARVYEEFGTAGSLSWFTQRHLSILSAVPEKIPEGYYFSEINHFEEIYRHPRNQERDFICRKPFFVVMVELSEHNKNAFSDWYQNIYLPKTMADIPIWSACRRYRSVDRTVPHEFTIYEAENEADLARGFELLRKDYRYSSNEAWAKWVGETILAQDAACFRPIFHHPE